MERRHGFTLIELMIVVAVVAIVSAVAIPSLQNARKSGNEASAISSLRTLSSVNEQYRTRFSSYAGSLADLETGGYIDSNLGSGSKSGYSFRYVPGSTPGVTWACQADPAVPGTTGDRYFFIDHTGVIRTSRNGSASGNDTPVDPGGGGGNQIPTS